MPSEVFLLGLLCLICAAGIIVRLTRTNTPQSDRQDVPRKDRRELRR